MAKFCKYCGKPLSEGENCTCPEAVAEAELRESKKQAETISGSTADMETAENEAAESVKPNPGQAYSGQPCQGQAYSGQPYQGQAYSGQPYQPSAFSLAAKKAFRMWQSFFNKPDTVLTEAFSDPDKKAQWFIGGVWALLFIFTTQIARGAFVKNLVRQLVWNLSGTDGGNMPARSFAALFSGRAFHRLDAAMAGGVLVSVLILILCRFLYAVIVYEMSRKQNPGKTFQAVITLFLTASIPEIPAIIITFIFSLTGALSLTLIFIGLCFIINLATFYMATEIALKEEKKSTYYTALLANAGMLLAWAILSGSFAWGLTENILKMMML